MSAAPPPLPAHIEAFLKGAASSASVPVGIGAPSGAPGEVRVGALGIAKINDQAIIKESGEPATIIEGNPRIYAHGRGVSGQAHAAEGMQTKTLGGLDQPDTNGCVLMSSETATKCILEISGQQTSILDEQTKPAQKAAQDNLTKSANKLKKAQHKIAHAKKPQTIQSATDQIKYHGGEAAKHGRTVGNFGALKRAGYIGTVITGFEAGMKALACEPAAAVGGVGKAVISGAVGGTAGTVSAGACSGATALAGTVACVGGGIAVGMGTAELTADGLDSLADWSGLSDWGASIDAKAMALCKTYF